MSKASWFNEPYRDTPFEKGSGGVYNFIMSPEESKQHEEEVWGYTDLPKYLED